MTKGKSNFMWKGGIAEYPNHYLMKKNRLIKLQQTKAKCEVCGLRANTIHRKDFSVNNHKLNNLIVLCNSCHIILHKAESRHKLNYKPTSKFIRLYGMTLSEIANKYGGSSARYFGMHKQGKLKDFLQRNKNDQT